MEYSVSFKAVLTSKVLTQDPVEGECVKLDFAEYKPIPPPIITSSGGDSEIAREVAPIIQQVIKSMPFTRRGLVKTPRLTLWLTRREWDMLEPKPDIGDEVTIVVESGRVSIKTG
ncbi:arcadin 1 [Candidatus Bathyarchaeota archaeon]|nr:arcadin 1 [Candidatus Bathyarchaeota archaeon]